MVYRSLRTRVHFCTGGLAREGGVVVGKRYGILVQKGEDGDEDGLETLT